MPAHIGFLTKATSLAYWSKAQKSRQLRRYFKGFYIERRANAQGASTMNNLAYTEGNGQRADNESVWHDNIINPIDWYDYVRGQKIENRYLKDNGATSFTRTNKIVHSEYAITSYIKYRSLIMDLDPAKQRSNAAARISQNEWDLYFRQGTEFDEEIETLFTMEYKLLVILSKGKPRHIKRIEAMHESLKDPIIVWTHA